MPVSVPVTKNLSGHVVWTRGGVPVAPPAGLTVTLSDPAKATLTVFADGSFHVAPLAAGDVTVTVSGSGATVSDTVTIDDDPIVGTFVWAQF